jgi:hypothetical protein
VDSLRPSLTPARFCPNQNPFGFPIEQDPFSKAGTVTALRAEMPR